jgi:hypothetical protein
MTTNIIKSTKAPNLPIAPIGYSQTYQEIHDNVLRLYFNQLDIVNNQTIAAINALSIPSAGTTASRPSTSLLVGQQYFDTTINRPIWWNGTNWINAAGTVV